MADQLFPTFDFPEIDESDMEEERYSPSVYFDFTKGDFVLDGANKMTVADGKDAFIQWCIKIVHTERYSCLAYDGDIGTELESLADAPSRDEKESLLKDTITDALSVHPAYESVDDFSFEYQGDECVVTFTIKGYPWNEEILSVSIPTQ